MGMGFRLGWNKKGGSTQILLFSLTSNSKGVEEVNQKGHNNKQKKQKFREPGPFLESAHALIHCFPLPAVVLFSSMDFSFRPDNPTALNARPFRGLPCLYVTVKSFTLKGWHSINWRSRRCQPKPKCFHPDRWLPQRLPCGQTWSPGETRKSKHIVWDFSFTSRSKSKIARHKIQALPKEK